MKLAIVQFNIKWEDQEVNLVRAKEFIDQASKDKCELIVFPEMFNSGFSMDSQKIAINSESKLISEIKKIAKDFNINILFGCAMKHVTLPQNNALIIDSKGEVLGQYTKNYPFSYAQENLNYSSGEQQLIFKLNELKASVFICYDLRFPELFRKVARDVEVIFVIANWPQSRRDHWKSLLKARAIENQCYIIGVNRIGEDGNQLKYSGDSMVIDPWGEVEVLASDKEEYFTHDLEYSKVQQIREKFPFLKDIKPQ